MPQGFRLIIQLPPGRHDPAAAKASPHERLARVDGGDRLRALEAELADAFRRIRRRL